MSDVFLSTAPALVPAPLAQPPMPTSPGDLYILGLLEMRGGLTVARKALNARAAFADADETRLILIHLGLVQADRVKLDAMITAYLSSSTISLAIDQERLKRIRTIVEQLQGLTAQRDKVADIVSLVTKLLNDWTPDPKPAAPAAVTAADLIVGLDDA